MVDFIFCGHWAVLGGYSWLGAFWFSPRVCGEWNPVPLHTEPVLRYSSADFNHLASALSNDEVMLLHSGNDTVRVLFKRERNEMARVRLGRKYPELN